MRLKIQFGFGGRYREMVWWRDIKDFPKMVKLNGDVFQWLTYGKDHTGKVDTILTFTRSYHHDPKIHISEFSDLFPYATKTNCQCGAGFTSFPQLHMQYCPEYKKKDDEEDPEPFEDWN